MSELDESQLRQRFAMLTTANLTDGCLRAGVIVRVAPPSISAVTPGDRLVGRAAPARHVGSVDVFLEAFEIASPGDVLVVDNGGRLDESCVGDLVVLEALAAGLQGIVIWGLHRDTVDIRTIGLPVFSAGSISNGPLSVGSRSADSLDSARVGEWTVTRDDVVFGDEDGVLFVPAARVEDVFSCAESIRDTERRQADRIRDGISLRDQVHFAEFLQKRAVDSSLTFREHLKSVGGAIEV